MSTKPILFNTEMVRAILDGRKTVTRRVVKPHNVKKAKLCEYAQGAGLWVEDGCIKDYSVSSCWMKIENYISLHAAYKPGDVLWVREAWNCNNFGWHYRADSVDGSCEEMYPEEPWSPSIHMPKAAARLFLRVKSVRVERLQEIMEAGAKAEGVTAETDNSGKMHRSLFVRLWNSTIKSADLPRYGWDANPWIYVIEFERIAKDEAMQQMSGIKT